MTSMEALEVARDAFSVLLLIAAPVLLSAMAVGLLISLFQALTQIQETTLTFVPKIVVVFVVLIVFFPFIGGHVARLTERLAERIVHSDE